MRWVIAKNGPKIGVETRRHVSRVQRSRWTRPARRHSFRCKKLLAQASPRASAVSFVAAIASPILDETALSGAYDFHVELHDGGTSGIR